MRHLIPLGIFALVSSVSHGAEASLQPPADKAPSSPDGETPSARPSAKVYSWPPTEKIEVVRAKAEEGDTGAQCHLGLMYLRGSGIKRNDAEAAKWISTAAAEGNSEAEYNLSAMYAHGQGVPRNPKESLKWLLSAADHGYAHAQHDLAGRYFLGDVVPKDWSKAAEWNRKASDQGFIPAKYNLAGAFYAGWGVPLDYAEARKLYIEVADDETDYTNAPKWYKDGVKHARMGAQFNLGCMYMEGAGLPKDDAEALKWLRRAEKSGNPQAKRVIFKMLNRSGSQDALMALQQAAAGGDMQSQYDLGVKYYYGKDGFTKNYAEAVKWLTLAAKKKPWSPLAKYDLAYMYAQGQGVAQSQAKSESFYQESMNEYRQIAYSFDMPGSYFKIGILYYFGQGVKQNYGQAARFFRKAAELNDSTAQYSLGFLYANGLGVKRDYLEADKWFRRAAGQNYKTPLSRPLGFSYAFCGLPTNSIEMGYFWLKKANEGDAVAQFNLAVVYATDYSNALRLPSMNINSWDNESTLSYVFSFDVLMDSLNNSFFGQIITDHFVWHGLGFLKTEVFQQVLNDSVSSDTSQVIARMLFEKAAKQGNLMAQEILGGNSNWRISMPSGNIDETDDWCHKAANAGSELAQMRLGLNSYKSGWNLDVKRASEAAKWYTMAANQGNVEAQEILGILYAGALNSTGVSNPKHYIEAYARFAVFGELSTPKTSLPCEDIANLLDDNALKKAKIRAKEIMDALPKNNP